MKLTFLGASRQVTGSRYFVEAAGARIMVDCGLFQEREFQSRNWDVSPIAPVSVDALLLTHAHVDHVGLAPRFVEQGFRGPLYATPATIDLARIVLHDAAKIQVEDAAYKRARHRRENRRGPFAEIPLYTPADVRRLEPRMRPVKYGQPLELAPGVRAIYHDAGHILGSAMIELIVREDDRERRLLFSGDIGQCDKPIIRDPSVLRQADFIVMESTYGDRNHENNGDIETQFAHILQKTFDAGGQVIIPTFAIERSQELMFYLGRLLAAKRIPAVPVYLDSPMAIDALEVFRRHRECFDEQAWNLINAGQSLFKFPELRLARSVEESKAINRVETPCVIMATSGMCTGGRIKHHLRRHLGTPECTILFVGFQAHGTLGRQILDGQPEVRIHGRKYPVRANIERIYGFSAHADRAGLLHWLGQFQTPPEHLFLTHGEEHVALQFAETVRGQFSWQVTVPEYLQQVEL